MYIQMYIQTNSYMENLICRQFEFQSPHLKFQNRFIMNYK